MRQYCTRRSVVIALTTMTAVAVGVVVHLGTRAHAADGTVGGVTQPAAPAAQVQDLDAQRREIEQGLQQIREARISMNQLLYERLKSIKLRRGLTPKQATAFDKAFAAELERLDQAERRLTAALQNVTARERSVKRTARAARTTDDDGILTRLDDLEQRVTILEMATPK